MTPWISSSAFKSILLELIMRGLHEREVISTTNPISSHWSLFSHTNRQLRFWAFNRAERVSEDVLSAMSRTGKNTDTKKQTCATYWSRFLTHKQGAPIFGLKQMQSWSKGIITAMSKWKKEKNHGNGQWQASSTLKTGFTVEYFSVCWMRRAEVGS
jgi:hypothetical protein